MSFYKVSKKLNVVERCYWEMTGKKNPDELIPRTNALTDRQKFPPTFYIVWYRGRKRAPSVIVEALKPKSTIFVRCDITIPIVVLTYDFRAVKRNNVAFISLQQTIRYLFVVSVSTGKVTFQWTKGCFSCKKFVMIYECNTISVCKF